MITTVDDFDFFEDSHSYVSEGRKALNVTGLLKTHGLSNYGMVKAEIMEAARERGKALHAWTAIHDREGNADFLSLPEEWVGYAEGYLLFRKQSGMEIVEIEKPLMALVHGVLIAGTPDRKCRWKRTREVTPDLKFCSATMPGWGIQTGFYEVIKKRKLVLGNTDRCTVRIMRDGKYDLRWHTDESDADVISSIVTLEAWKKNHNLSNGRVSV